MEHSDIFEEYAQLMADKGLISKTAAAEEREEKYSDKEWRENIEALYGVKNELNDSKDNIIDQAHPDYVIPTMSYDKLNSLVENIWQRNDIMKGIVNKPVTGGEFRHIYAQGLLDDLIKIGFDAENSGDDEIRALADSCSEKIVKGFEKEAQWLSFLANPKTVLTVASILGSIVGFDIVKDRTMGLVSGGIQPDIDRTLERLAKLEEVAFPDGKQEASKWISVLTGYKKLSDHALSIMSRPSHAPDDISTPAGLNAVLENQSKLNGTQEEIKYVHEYIKASQNLASHIPVAVDRIKSIQVQKEHSSLGDWFDDVKQWVGAAVGNISSDTALALEALGKSINNTIKAYVDVMPEAKQAAVEHKESIADTLSNFGSSLSGAISSSDQKASDKLKGLLGAN